MYASMLMNVFPLDMSQYHGLFNSTRVPLVNAQDELVSFKSSDQSKYGHVLVMRNDNLYTIKAVQGDGEWRGEGHVGGVKDVCVWAWRIYVWAG